MKEKKSFLFKLGLIGLAVASVVIASFTHADTVSSLISITNSTFLATTTYKNMIDFGAGVGQKVVCIGLTWNGGGDNMQVGFVESSGATVSGPYTFWRDWNGKYNCLTKGANTRYMSAKLYSSTATITVKYFFLDDLLNANLPEMTSLECQTQYSLIPISSVDQSYCESNNLCPAGSGSSPSDCPNIGVSNLFINDIFHPGAFNVVINIPEEIDRDYAYTNSGYNFNLDIVGYNVDYTKVQDQIDIQSYKPNTEDLNSIISGVIPLFIPGLIIILFLYFIFRFIKKIF